MDRRCEGACLGVVTVAPRLRSGATESTPRALAISGKHGQRRALLALFKVGDACPSQAEPGRQLGLRHAALLPKVTDGPPEGLQEICRHANKPDLPSGESQPD